MFLYVVIGGTVMPEPALTGSDKTKENIEEADKTNAADDNGGTEDKNKDNGNNDDDESKPDDHEEPSDSGAIDNEFAS